MDYHTAVQMTRDVKLEAYREANPTVRIGHRFGHLVRFTAPRKFIDYTPRAEDMAATDWRVVNPATGEYRMLGGEPAPRVGTARGTGWRRP